jgi:hypothetical protein
MRNDQLICNSIKDANERLTRRTFSPLPHVLHFLVATKAVDIQDLYMGTTFS